MDLPATPPEEVQLSASLRAECVAYAAERTDIHPLVIEAVIEVEGGQIGTISENGNGTHDLGIMQLNTINLPLIQRHFPRVGWRELVFNPCVNIAVGAWFLKRKITEAGSLWTGVGNYHSATPHVHQRYLERITRSYKRLYDRYQRSRGR